MRTRSITYFIKPRKWEIDYIKEKIENAYDTLERIAAVVNEFAEVWTLRIAMPPVPPYFDMEELASVKIREGFMYAPIHLDAKDERIKAVPEILLNYNVYGSIRIKDYDDVERAVDVLLRLSERDYQAATRLAFVLGKRLATPYFPLAATGTKEGFAISLLYVREAIKDLGSAIRLPYRIREMGREVEKVGRKLRVEFLGFDLSLSPWMEESVGELVEKVAGVKIPDPGTLHAISRINQYIRDLLLVSGVKVTGFNELMMPVGEDVVLKERVREGVLNLRDLSRLASVCVAGVDMVAVNYNWAKEWLSSFVVDLLDVHKVKRRVMGIRVLPVKKRKGEVRFDRFGDIPIANY